MILKLIKSKIFKQKMKSVSSSTTLGLPGSELANSTTGFTLVELIVVIGIMGIMTSVIIFNYGKFSSNLIVTNLAYEAALAVREAQVYGISVKQTKSGTSNFNAAYGVWFSSGDGQNFYLFSDLYDTKKISENKTEESFSMNGSNFVRNFCITTSGGRKCSQSVTDLKYLSIIFKRPEPNAKIYGFNSDSIQTYEGSKAEIMFTSGRSDKTARMTVTNIGQISIDSCNTSCPQ